MPDTEYLGLAERELDDALFGRVALGAPRRLVEPRIASNAESAVMREALAAMDRAGRESKAWRESRGRK